MHSFDIKVADLNSIKFTGTDLNNYIMVSELVLLD